MGEAQKRFHEEIHVIMISRLQGHGCSTMDNLLAQNVEQDERFVKLHLDHYNDYIS
jgi:hypothetical protein